MLKQRIHDRETKAGLLARMSGAIVAAAGLAVAAPAIAQDTSYDYEGEHYEWEAGEGFHEEEWYDPSDWFDDDFGERVVDYEDDDWFDDYDYYDGYYDNNAYSDWDDSGLYDDDWYEEGIYYDRDSDYDASDYRYDNRYGYETQRGDGIPYYTRDNRNRDANRYANTSPQGGKAELRGELDGWTRVSIQGQKDAHTLLRLRLDDGRTKVINIGPRMSVDRLNLDDGDRVAVYGSQGKIDGRQVLMVEKMRVGEQTVTMGDWFTGNQRRTADANRDSRSGAEANRNRNANADRQRNAQANRDRMHPGARHVQQVISSWPQASKNAAESMLKKYGKPAGVTPDMLVWKNTGPFVKTIVHKRTVDHKFPAPHQDVLEQFVNFKVPADKMDDLAKFDGSIIVYRTDGVMSARCHKEPMNLLALNLAADIVKGERSVDEARSKYADAANAYKNGNRPELTQRLTFDSSSGNSDSADWSDQRHRGSQSQTSDDGQRTSSR